MINKCKCGGKVVSTWRKGPKKTDWKGPRTFKCDKCGKTYSQLPRKQPIWIPLQDRKFLMSPAMLRFVQGETLAGEES